MHWVTYSLQFQNVLHTGNICSHHCAHIHCPFGQTDLALCEMLCLSDIIWIKNKSSHYLMLFLTFIFILLLLTFFPLSNTLLTILTDRKWAKSVRSTSQPFSEYSGSSMLPVRKYKWNKYRKYVPLSLQQT